MRGTNVGFGKRGMPREPGSSSGFGLDDDAGFDPRGSRDAQEGLSGAALTVVMVIVSIVVGVAAALLYSTFFGSSHSSLVAAAQANAGTAAHDWIAATCMPPAGRGARRIGVTDEEFRYQGALRSPSYFSCALMLERERFCGADERALVVKELQTYFAHIAARQQIIDTYAKDLNAKAMMKMAVAVQGKDGGIATGPPRIEPSAAVVGLLQGLVRDGYLRAGDFGWSVPQEIATHLKGVEKLKTSC